MPDWNVMIDLLLILNSNSMQKIGLREMLLPAQFNLMKRK